MKHYLGLCLVLVTAAAIFLFLLRRCENAAARAAAGVAQTFQSVLQVKPEIRVNQTVITTQTAPIAELAIVSKEELVSYTFTEKLRFAGRDIPLTGKKIVAEAVYRIKAGYDLRQPFHVSIHLPSNRIIAQMPPARILSVERIGDLSLRDHDSILNRVTSEERQSVLNQLDLSAHEFAVRSGLVQDAEKQAVNRLLELARQNGQNLLINPPTK